VSKIRSSKEVSKENVKFLHLRDHEVSLSGDNSHSVEAPRGGCTIGYVEVDRNESTMRVLYTFARCAPIDSFCKAIGRNICTGRLTKGVDVGIISVPVGLARHEVHNILKNKYYENEEVWDHTVRRHVF